ncbi:hypothetical protein ACH4GK_42635 [Streptomyces rimosus]|nr:hypothetical protein [Streptomyces rimosus]
MLRYAVLCAISRRKCSGFGFHFETDRRGRLRPGKVCRRCCGDR